MPMILFFIEIEIEGERGIWRGDGEEKAINKAIEVNTGPTFSAGLSRSKVSCSVHHRSTTSMFVSKGHEANMSSGLIRLLTDI